MTFPLDPLGRKMIDCPTSVRHRVFEPVPPAANQQAQSLAREIFEEIQRQAKPVTSLDLSAALGLTTQRLSSQLHALERARRIRRVGKSAAEGARRAVVLWEAA